MRPFLSVLLTVTFLSANVRSQTPVPAGDVCGTWTLLGSPYQVQGTVTIPNDSTLAIEPGVTVAFQGHYALQVQGRLLALGTEADTIVFTVSDTTGFSQVDTTLGGWHGIRLFNTPPENDSTILEYCRLEYGKAVGPNWPFDYGGAISVVNFHKVRISNCLITNNMAAGPIGPAAGGVGITSSDIVLTGNSIVRNHSEGQAGGLYLYDSNVRFADNRIMENSAGIEGGGMFIMDGSTISFSGDSIASNSTPGHGGGIMMLGVGDATFQGVAFSSNSGFWGGGLGAVNCSLKVNNSIFENNSATWLGGAVSADFSSLEFTDIQMTENRAQVHGGGFHQDHCTLVVRNASLLGNVAGSDTSFGGGGGINAASCKVRLEHCSFLADTATVGGGMNVFNSDLQLDSLLLQYNVARDHGGALFYSADTAALGRPYEVSLVRSQIRENRATNLVAGVRVDELGEEPAIVETIIDRCAFTGNTADRVTALRFEGDGQVFHVSNTVIMENTCVVRVPGVTVTGGARGTFSNCLIAGNTTGTPLAVTQDAVAHLINSTIAHNADSGGAAISMRVGAQVSLTNCIVWGNPNRALNLVTLDSLRVCKIWVNHCLIEGGRDSVGRPDTLSEVHWGVGNIDMNPLFEDSGNRNYRLFSGSPCIGAGIDSIEVDGAWYRAPSLDLDGHPRPSPPGTHPDMGAYEDQVTVPVGVDQGSELAGPRTYALYQNYPNPFNPNSEVKYQISGFRDVRLVVYDILGRQVAVLVNERKAPGDHQVTFNATGLASGVYLYRLTAGTYVQTKKMILMK